MWQLTNQLYIAARTSKYDLVVTRLSKKTTRHNIQQKTRHYWDIYTTYDIEFLRRKKWKKKCEKKFFFQNFKFFYIKLPNVICCIQCHDMCCLLDVFCCILMSWHMLRHWTVYPQLNANCKNAFFVQQIVVDIGYVHLHAEYRCISLLSCLKSHRSTLPTC